MREREEAREAGDVAEDAVAVEVLVDEWHEVLLTSLAG